VLGYRGPSREMAAFLPSQPSLVSLTLQSEDAASSCLGQGVSGWSQSGCDRDLVADTELCFKPQQRQRRGQWRMHP
jgi:hypothetical protein